MPYGKVGRDFIDQITLHVNDWNSGSDNQHICLKAAFVPLALGPQNQTRSPRQKIIKTSCLSALRIGDKVKSASYYEKVELFKVDMSAAEE